MLYSLDPGDSCLDVDQILLRVPRKSFVQIPVIRSLMFKMKGLFTNYAEALVFFYIGKQ